MSSDEKDKANELWCFRTETAKLLGLSVTQIHTSLTDGDNSIGTLTDSFQQLADFCSSVQELASEDESNHKSKAEINELATNMSSSIDNAIVAFQFYDRLSQRMGHVSGSLEQLSELIKNEDSINDPDGWESLRDHIKSSYSMDAEHVMYEAIMKGSSIKDALEIYKKEMHEADASDDIELF
ncbi:MAG: hypothetical protein ACI8WB_000382 [Phenylobacterium sp.]|jgi:hypothetical protein